MSAAISISKALYDFMDADSHRNSVENKRITGVVRAEFSKRRSEAFTVELCKARADAMLMELLQGPKVQKS